LERTLTFITNAAQVFGTWLPETSIGKIRPRTGEIPGRRTTQAWNINHNNPTNDTYSIGAHYYADKGFGTSIATVRIYLNGALEAERTMTLQTTGTFWHVADLQIPSQTLTFIDSVTNGFP
jgi:hypothetical protein